MLIFSGLIAASAGVRAQQRPNGVFITIDTLRADHLGCYG
jgi:arylsulfatase A-like enzyme